MLSNDENVGVLIEAWKLMVERFPEAEIHQSDGVATIFANIALPFLNVSVPHRPLTDAEDLRGVLAVARKRAAACAHPSLLALCEAWAPSDWEQVAAEEGFALALNMTGMAADRLLPPRRALPELEFRRVQTEAEGHGFGRPVDGSQPHSQPFRGK